MQVETWQVKDLIPYAKNPRKNDHAVEIVAKNIKEFGFRVPILAKSNGEVIDGHLRIKAAQKLKLKELPVIICDDMTPTQIKAFRLSVNKMATLADWDSELLNAELGELSSINFNLDLIGFDLKLPEVKPAPIHTNISVGESDYEDEEDPEPEPLSDYTEQEASSNNLGGVAVPLLIDNCPRSTYKKFNEIKRTEGIKHSYELLQLLLEKYYV
jgi:ParB-like chromosome segregation protein Spo0J